MLRRTTFLFVALAFVLGACSSDTNDAAAPTTERAATTSITAGTTQTTPTSGPSTPESIPLVTPPPGQPAACDLLVESAFPGAAVDPSALTPLDRPRGDPAPATGCSWSGTNAFMLSLYYGRDPLETMAAVRLNAPSGTDVVGVGADAYVVIDKSVATIFVDTGSQAFSIQGQMSSDELQALAQKVISNL